jgi:hypothetical protein
MTFAVKSYCWRRKQKQGGIIMYINPFWAGVLATVIVELALLVVAGIITTKKK